MGGELSTPACQIKSHILWIKFEPGWLQLKDGLIAFKSEASGLLFRVPLAEVRASFPKVIFPVPYFGTGVKLAVNGKTYRLSFIRNFMESQYIGWTSDNLGGEGRAKDKVSLLFRAGCGRRTRPVCWPASAAGAGAGSGVRLPAVTAGPGSFRGL